jgi:hypothetical protein
LLGTEEGKQKGRNRLREGKRVCPAQIEERGVERGEERRGRKSILCRMWSFRGIQSYIL